MRILFVLENYHPFIGGAEVLFKNLCEGLSGRGHEITVLTTRHRGTAERESINGVNVIRINVPRSGARYWFTFLSIGAAIRLALRADIVHTTTYNGAFPAWLAARMAGKKCVITVLEILGKHWKEMMAMNALISWLHRFLEKIIVRLPFNHIVAISQYTSSCLQELGVGSRRISVIYPGIDYNLFDRSKADRASIRNKLGIGDEFIYFYYGRPGISKGVEYLVKAIPLVSGKIMNSRLVMLLAHEPKDGYERIRSMIDSMGMSDRVLLLDPVPRDQLPSYVAAADCVVVPSISEGFGFSAAEACALGVPVVASNIASLPEVVSGKHLLVEPRNPQAIAFAVEAVYNSKVNFTDHKTFKWSDCVDQYERLNSRLSGAVQGENR